MVEKSRQENVGKILCICILSEKKKIKNLRKKFQSDPLSVPVKYLIIARSSISPTPFHLGEMNMFVLSRNISDY